MTTETREVVAIRHVGFEHLGTFAPVLRERFAAVRYVEAGRDDIAGIDAASPALIAVLGGPIGAYEEAAYPFLLDELALIQRRLAEGGALLGVCLGAQLIARALGARVYPGAAKEIGWAPVELTDEGRASPLGRLRDCGNRVLHWHGDTFDLPAGAARLASTAITENQAFALGGDVLGLQFHVEIDPAEIEHWLIGHACEIAATDGAAVGTIRDDTRAFGPALAACGPRLLTDWLDGNGRV